MRKLPLLALLAITAATLDAPAEVTKKARKVGPVRRTPPPPPPPTPVVEEEPEERPDLHQQKLDDMERRRQALPKPPSADPADYDRWSRKLPLATRRTIEKFCIENPTDFEESCGGIGIHRIPVPPSLVPMKGSSGGGDHAQWEKDLNPLQRSHYQRYCNMKDMDHAYSPLCGGTPLVISFDNQPVAFTAVDRANPARFELYPGDSTMTVDWPTAATPWLALDRDGDGAITSGAELFGDATRLPNGQRARHGFEALAALDANGDGKIDRADPMFASLLLWADRNGDRKSSPDELVPASRTIDSISLGYHVEVRCDARVNCERERAAVTWHDGSVVKTGSVVDVYLRFQ